MRISLIAAAADNGVLADEDDRLPWRLPRDMRWFRRTTMGHWVLMGRRTWDTLSAPLEGRTNVVLSRGHPELPEGVRLVDSLEEGVEAARGAGESELFVAGGGEVYALALPRADRIYLTRVHARPEGGPRFPEIDETAWRVRLREEYRADGDHTHDFTLLVLDRLGGADAGAKGDGGG